MEFVFTCLMYIELVFMLIWFFVGVFFKRERSLVHQSITATIVFIAYVLETILTAVSNKNFTMPILLVILWGMQAFRAIYRLKQLRKSEENNEEENIDK